MSMRPCSGCKKDIPLFSEFWLREPDTFNARGVAVKRGKAWVFCGLSCILGWAGKQLRGRQKTEVGPQKRRPGKAKAAKRTGRGNG